MLVRLPRQEVVYLNRLSNRGLLARESVVCMTDRIESTLKKLASVSQSLNQASDKVTSCIADVEAALREYKLGIEVWIDIGHWVEGVRSSHGGFYKLGRTRRLGYGKKDGKWGLLTCVNAEESEEYEEFAFLREAPRDARLAAIDRLPELLEALVEKAVKTSHAVTKKAEKAEQIAAGLNKKQVAP